MPNDSLYRKILGASPYIEILVRHIYWKNVKTFKQAVNLLSKLRKKEITTPLPATKVVPLETVMNYLKAFGIKEGDTMVVHSSYDALKVTRKLPRDINHELLSIVGTSGNLVMPVNRTYSKTDSLRLYETVSDIDVLDVNKTKVSTGALGFMLMRHPEAVKSRYPINSIVAVGALSKEMTQKNLEGDKPTPCGTNSAWKYCHDLNAYIIGLGIDLTHSLTMTHVVEDAWENEWNIEGWYDERTFKIIDTDFEQTVTIRERRPKWGKLFFAERKLCKDLLAVGIMTSVNIEGITIEIIKSHDLVQFLKSKNKTGYPFYCVGKKKSLKNNVKENASTTRFKAL